MRSSRGNIAEPRAKLTTLLLATRYNRAMVIHRRLFWLFLVALLAGCASTPRPRPQTPTRIATIVPLDDNAIPTARALRDALNGQAAHVASVEQALGDAPRSAPSSQAVAPTQRAHAALQQAHQAYQQLRFRDALEVLTSAQQALVATDQDGTTLELLRRVALASVLNHLALKDEQAARNALGLALSFGYGGPEPGELPPETVRFIEETRAQRSASSSVKLRLDSQPSRASVHVDGKRHGTTPLTVSLPPGQHLLRLERLGYHHHAVIQQFGPTTSSPDITLEPLTPTRAATQLVQMSRVGRASEILDDGPLASSLFGPRRGLLSVRPQAAQKQASLLWTGRDGPQPQTVRCIGPDDGTLAKCLAERVRALSMPTNKAGHTVAAPSVPFYRHWWFWTAVGGVVAAGTGVGVYFATRTPDGVDIDVQLRSLR